MPMTANTLPSTTPTTRASQPSRAEAKNTLDAASAISGSVSSKRIPQVANALSAVVNPAPGADLNGLSPAAGTGMTMGADVTAVSPIPESSAPRVRPASAGSAAHDPVMATEAMVSTTTMGTAM